MGIVMIERTLSKNKGKVSFSFTDEGLFLCLEDFYSGSKAEVMLKQKEFEGLLNNLNYYKARIYPVKNTKIDKKVEIVKTVERLLSSLNYLDDFPILKKDLSNFLIRLL